MNIKSKYLYIFLISLAFIFLGFIFFIFKRNLLVIKFIKKPTQQQNLESVSQLYSKKEILFYFFKDDKLNFENRKIVWFKDKSKTLKHLINAWFVFLQEERILKKKISLDFVLLDKTENNVFLSFDQPLFEEDWSIYFKWNFIESLLKTIKSSGLRISNVTFLVDHKKMDDEHLDFSNSWPLEGYY